MSARISGVLVSNFACVHTKGNALKDIVLQFNVLTCICPSLISPIYVDYYKNNSNVHYPPDLMEKGMVVKCFYPGGTLMPNQGCRMCVGWGGGA